MAQLLNNAAAWIATPMGIAFMGWLFATVVGGMPPPTNGNVWYTWMYNTLQRVAANHALTVSPTPTPPTLPAPPAQHP